MENRFGVKDFFLFLLLIILIGVVILAMFQYDRQWQSMQQTNRLLTEQTTDLSRIRRLVESGAGAVATSGPSTSAVSSNAGFERILKSQSSPDFANGGQLVQLSQTTGSKLTPLIASDAGAFEVWGYVMDTLVARDPDTLDWKPSLAESWKISDDSLTIDFKLRRGITFSDGSPMTADDVKYTFDQMCDERIEDPIFKVGASKIAHVDKLDDFSVRFVFKEPYFSSFETAGTTPIMSKAFYSKYSPTEFNRSTGLLIGSGPYRLPDPTSWRPTPGQPLVLVRNERYWGPTPSFDRVIWNVIQEPSARLTAFRNGDIDSLGGVSGPPTPEQYDQMVADPKLLARTNHWELDTPSAGYFYLGWNEKHGRAGAPTAFADTRVRRAMTLLTDRDSIMKNIILGHGSVITGPFPPTSLQCDSSIKPLPYDPDAAVKLLAEAGFHKQGDRLIGPDGNPLSFKLLFNTNSVPRRRIASFLHDAYARVGIDAQPEQAEWSVFLKRIDDRDFDVIVGAWSGGIESDPFQIFDSSQSAATGENFIQFNNKDVDTAIAKARSTVDQNKRMPLWHAVGQLLHEQQPYTFLFIDKELDFVQNRIHGVTPTKVLGINSLLEWYVPRAAQVAN